LKSILKFSLGFITPKQGPVEGQTNVTVFGLFEPGALYDW